MGEGAGYQENQNKLTDLVVQRAFNNRQFHFVKLVLFFVFEY